MAPVRPRLFVAEIVCVLFLVATLGSPDLVEKFGFHPYWNDEALGPVLCHMHADDFPAPGEGFVLTHFLVVADQDRSREFYKNLFDAQVLVERDPVIMKVANSWLILNVGGGPTDDKPSVTLATPQDPNLTSAFLNVRVADIATVYREWTAKGAQFLTEPKDHGREIRAYVRDPDGHLIEVGQATGVLQDRG